MMKGSLEKELLMPFKIITLIFLTACSSASLSNLKSMDHEEAYERGVDSYENNEFSMAIAFFDRAQEKSELKFKAVEGKLACFKHKKDYERFIFEANSYLAVHGAFDIAIRTQLAEVYQSVGRNEEALKVYDQILSFNPSNSSALISKTNIYLASGQPELSIKPINTLLVINPKSKDAYILRSKAHVKQGDLSSAIKDLNEILSFKKDDKQTLELLVEIYYDIQDWQSAYDLSNSLYEAGGNKTDVSLIRSSCLVKMGRFSEANFLLNEILESHTDISTKAYVANLFLESRNFQKARELYSQIIKVDPSNDDANFQLVKLVIDENDFFRAGGMLQALHAAEPNKEWIVLSYAKLLHHVNARSNARKILETFLKSHNSIEGHLALIEINKVTDEHQAVPELASSMKFKSGENPPVNLMEKKSQVLSREVAATPAQLNVYVTIKVGDSLGAFSHQYYGDSKYWVKIYAANRDVISNPSNLPLGKKIRIPNL